MATQADVRKRALRKLGLASTNQAPTSDLDSDMQAAYTEVYALLENMKLTFWGETSAVPDEVANHVAAMMAFERVNDYGIGSERYARIEREKNAAIRNFRMMAVNEYVSDDEVTDY